MHLRNYFHLKQCIIFHICIEQLSWKKYFLNVGSMKVTFVVGVGQFPMLKPVQRLEVQLVLHKLCYAEHSIPCAEFTALQVFLHVFLPRAPMWPLL